MEKELFIKRLIDLRMNKGVSARDMSLSIGQSQSYINNIENGKALPSASLLRRSANDFIQNVSNEGFTLRVKEYRTFLQTGENTHTYEKDTATLYVTAKDGKAYLKAEDGDDLYEEWYADG